MNLSYTRPDGLPPMTRRELDTALLTYLDALDDGDFETIAALMEAHGADESFAEALSETNLFLAEEIEAAQESGAILARDADAVQVRDLASAALSAPVAATRAEAEIALRKAEADEAEADVVPPLTVRDVAAQLKVNAAQGVIIGREARTARILAERLESAPAASEEIPDDALTPRGAKSLLARFGLDKLPGIALANASRLFQEAAQTLDIRQEPLRLAAARRARQRRQGTQMTQGMQGANSRVRESRTPYPAPPQTNADANADTNADTNDEGKEATP